MAAIGGSASREDRESGECRPKCARTSKCHSACAHARRADSRRRSTCCRSNANRLPVEIERRVRARPDEHAVPIHCRVHCRLNRRVFRWHEQRFAHVEFTVAVRVSERSVEDLAVVNDAVVVAVGGVFDNEWSNLYPLNIVPPPSRIHLQISLSTLVVWLGGRPIRVGPVTAIDPLPSACGLTTFRRLKPPQKTIRGPANAVNHCILCRVRNCGQITTS